MTVTDVNNSAVAGAATSVPLGFTTETSSCTDATRQLLEQPRPATLGSTRSAASRDLDRNIDRVATTDFPIMLIGEHGVGKHTIARVIHDRSARANGPFLTIHCGALPRDVADVELFGSDVTQNDENPARTGRLELAHGGTLYLDEIDDLPLATQTKLLNFLTYGHIPGSSASEDQTPHVRLIVSSSRDLAKQCQAGYFLADLLQKINTMPVNVPPLRDRGEDVPALVEQILNRIGRDSNSSFRIENAALDALQQFSWPGNLRQLERVLERAAVHCRRGVIRSDDLNLPDDESPRTETSGRTLACRTLADVEKQAIIETLTACNGNKARTARVLGISEKSIYNKMRRHGLSNPV